MISAAGRKLIKGIKSAGSQAKPAATKPLARVANRQSPEGPMQRAGVRRPIAGTGAPSRNISSKPPVSKPMAGSKPSPKPGVRARPRNRPFGG